MNKSLKPKQQRLIILDRDGVINRGSTSYITHPKEWEALPGSLEAIAQLCRADYRVVVITNQAGIAKDLYTINTLNRIHQKMLDELQAVGGELSAIFFCPHADEQNCKCRKPKPGLFLELAQRLQCDLSETFAVGDSLRDLQAAHSAGAKPVLVKTGNGTETEKILKEQTIQKELNVSEIPIYNDLAEFVNTLLAGETKSADH